MKFKAIRIPEGSVLKIKKGENVIWSGKGYTLTLSGIGDYGFELAPNPNYNHNPDTNLYKGAYCSLNHQVPNSAAVMRIDFNGYTEFNIYIHSNAESTYDYIVATTLDAPEASETYTLASTKGNQTAYTDISSYTKVSYPNDGKSHHIYIFYKKDVTGNYNEDRGYVLLEK